MAPSDMATVNYRRGAERPSHAFYSSCSRVWLFVRADCRVNHQPWQLTSAFAKSIHRNYACHWLYLNGSNVSRNLTV